MYNFRNPFFAPSTFSRNNSNAARNINLNRNNYYETHHNQTTKQTINPAINQLHNKNVYTDSSVNVNTDEALFEIFGLKIYLDDILIICILFFLYQEGIQDEYLFISLILLLLS